MNAAWNAKQDHQSHQLGKPQSLQTTAVPNLEGTHKEMKYGRPLTHNWKLHRHFYKNGWSSNPTSLYLLTPDSVNAQEPTLIVPDKDADGLSSGVIIHRTLVKLGLDPKLLDVHLVQKGSNIHEEYERKLMLEKKAKFIIVLDQGSRGGPAVVDDPDTNVIIMDHHLSDDFPENAQVDSYPRWVRRY